MLILVVKQLLAQLRKILLNLLFYNKHYIYIASTNNKVQQNYETLKKNYCNVTIVKYVSIKYILNLKKQFYLIISKFFVFIFHKNTTTTTK